MNWLAVAIGGAIGALCRYAIVSYLVPVSPNRFPVGTLLVNVLGCICIGVLFVVVIQKNLLGPQWRLFLMTGLLGAFTTFSTFSIETLQLWQQGQSAMALSYVVLSFVLCLAGTGASVYLVHRLLQS